MKKRLISILLSVALLGAISLPAAASDSPSDWANDEVARALELGFVPEDLQGNYQSEITRWEFAKIAIYFLATQYGYPANTKTGDGTGMSDQVENFLTDYCDSMLDRNGETFDLLTYDPDSKNTTFRWWTAFTEQTRFTDIDYKETEMVGFVNAAYSIGIVNGTNDAGTTFNPTGSITRQEAAAMLERTYNCYAEIATATSATTYADQSEIASWAEGSIELMTQFGVMSGVGENTFSPNGTYTREQCIVTFMRLYDSAPEGHAQGNVEPFFTMEEEIERMMSLGTYGASTLYRGSTDEYTILYVGYLGGVQTYTAFRIINVDGGYRTIDLEKGYANSFHVSSNQDYLNCITLYGDFMAIELATGAFVTGWQ